jgi:16S rRNA (uracil1498-N3)-methyltransferase
MARHTIVLEGLGDAADELEVVGDAAKHAVRVKRLGPGETVRVLDGRGGYALTKVVEAGRVLRLEIERRGELEPIRPAVRVVSSAPKGQRLDKMLDMLGQVGAASWSPLETKLGVVEPGEGKLARAERIARETVKQCLRPTPMEIGAAVGLDAALDAAASRGDRVVVADAAGEPYTGVGSESVTMLVGPEGGFVEAEYELMLGRGATMSSFGPAVLRIETAAVVGAAIVMDAERRALGLIGAGERTGPGDATRGMRTG